MILSSVNKEQDRTISYDKITFLSKLPGKAGGVIMVPLKTQFHLLEQIRYKIENSTDWVIPRKDCKMILSPISKERDRTISDNRITFLSKLLAKGGRVTMVPIKTQSLYLHNTYPHNYTKNLPKI